MNAATFVRNHTTHDNDHPHEDECPICLDDYTSEPCLRIINIPGCSHHIGANCLDDMLRSHSDEEKRCPLCRAVWIPTRPLPTLRASQGLSASRRMAGMFAGLDGIGEDIANQQLGTWRGFEDVEIPRQLVPRLGRELPSPAGPYGLRASMEEQQRAAIVIDSDSDDADYDTHVRNFEELRRDLADIRSRAPYRQVSRRSRRRRVTNRNRDDDANEDVNSSSNSDNATATHGLGRMNASARGGTDVPGTGAFNRFLNNHRTLNPFRPTIENNSTTPNALDGGRLAERRREMGREHDRHRQDEHLGAVESSHQELLNRRRRLQERQTSNQQHIPDFESPPPHPPNVGSRRAIFPHAHLPSLSTPETRVDIDMTSDELIVLPAIQSPPAQAVRSQQLNHREGDLRRREQAMTTRQTTLARREIDLIARETRLDELMRVARRHQEEAEELVRRHRAEIAGLFELSRS